MVIKRPRLSKPAAHERAVALGQMLEHVALLVPDTPLDRRVYAEHVTDRLAERLGTVDDHQHTLFDVEAAFDEVGQQPERMLDALGVDAQRDHAAAALELDPIEH